MATYTRNSRMLKKYHLPSQLYGSMGPVNFKPKRLRIKSYLAKSVTGKQLNFMLIANK